MRQETAMRACRARFTLARGRCCWATTPRMLAAPRQLTHAPLLEQALVAIVVPGIAIVGQGCHYCWCWRRGRRAAALCSPAAIGLLPSGPSPLPVGVASIAIVRA